MEVDNAVSKEKGHIANSVHTKVADEEFEEYEDVEALKSRCHAKIKFSNGKFLLEDNTSKFGTLVLVKQRTPLLPNYNKAVQIGRTVLSVKANTHRTNVVSSQPLGERPRTATTNTEENQFFRTIGAG